MKSLKIVTGLRNKTGNPYWPDWYVANAFRKLGHNVTESEGAWTGEYDLGFAVSKMLIPRPRRYGFPVGFLGIDCATYIGRYRSIAKHFDVFFVDRYDVVKSYKEFCKKAVYLPQACDPETHRCPPAEERYDIGFVGRSTKERIRLLQALKKSGLKQLLYYPGSKSGIDRSKFISLPKLCLMYSQCKIIFNTIKDATNPRVYEVMSMGKLVLTSRRGSEPDHLFVDGKHLVVYEDEKDLVEKAKYYASHDEERRAIAKAGQQLVHEKHKWTDRMQFVIETLLGSGRDG